MYGKIIARIAALFRYIVAFVREDYLSRKGVN